MVTFSGVIIKAGAVEEEAGAQSKPLSEQFMVTSALVAVKTQHEPVSLLNEWRVRINEI